MRKRGSFSKYRLKSIGGHWQLISDTRNNVPSDILDYIYRFIINIFQSVSYLHACRFYIPYKNSIFLIIIRFCDGLNLFTIDITERDSVDYDS